MRHPGLVQRIVGGVASVGLAAMVAVEPALSLRTGPVLSRLAGTWAATLPNYPAVGLYKGRYRLRLGPGFTMRYIVPAEDAVPQRVSVFGNRITFMPSGVCLTSGTYVWNVHGNTLTFSKVTDACRKRVVQLVRRWTRIGLCELGLCE